MGYRIKAKSLAHTLLTITALGGIALAVILAPNALQMLGRRSGRHEWWGQRTAERRRIREALERLRRRRLVDFEVKGNETILTVTTAGLRYVRRFELDAVMLTRPKRWDGKWRLVMFDVPETKTRQRRAFKEKLRELGFHQLQKSVWVYPHACHDEIDFISQFLEVERYLIYIETDSLERNEGEVRRAFGLLSSPHNAR